MALPLARSCIPAPCKLVHLCTPAYLYMPATHRVCGQRCRAAVLMRAKFH
jgi:hypothetical protein